MTRTNQQKYITFRIAGTKQEFEDGKFLFKKYAASLDVDLSFQNFDEELETIADKYNTPGGALLIAYDNQMAIGCVALRRLDDDTAELKRLFVDPTYRGSQSGQKLLAQILEAAQKLGYKSVRLDTLAGMEAALKLYRSFGFKEIPPYRHNPLEDAIYMEKNFY